MDEIMLAPTEVAGHARWLRTYFADNHLPIGDRIERAIGNAERPPRSSKEVEEAQLSDEELRAVVTDVVFVSHLARLANRVPAQLAEWVRGKERQGESALAGNHDVNLADASRARTTQRNYMWEYVVAATCAGIGPIDSAEPDIGVAVDGRRWAIACKSVESHAKAWVRIKDGKSQVDGCECHAGLVFLNVTDLLMKPHDWLVPRTSVGQVESLLTDLAERRGSELAARAVRDRSRLRGVVLAAYSVVRVDPEDILLEKVARLWPVDAHDDEVQAFWSRYKASQQQLDAHSISQGAE